MSEDNAVDLSAVPPDDAHGAARVIEAEVINPNQQAVLHGRVVAHGNGDDPPKKPSDEERKDKGPPPHVPGEPQEVFARAESTANDVFEIGEKLASNLETAAEGIRPTFPRAGARVSHVADKLRNGAAAGRVAAREAIAVGSSVVTAAREVKKKGGAPLERLAEQLWKTEPLPGFPADK